MLLTTFGITSNDMKKILLTNLLVFVSWLALSQSQPIDPVYINTDSMASNTNNADLKLAGRGTGLVNIEGAYTLPGVDGTSGYLISTNGAGVWGYTDPSSLQVTFGTDNQVPFVNAGGTDFDYSANLTFDGTTATINSITLTTDLTVANGGTGASSFTDGGILYGNGTSAFSVTSAPTGADEFLVSTGAGIWGLESASSARTSLGLGTMATETATNYVPFTGAASSVNLNTQSLTAGAGSFTAVTSTSLRVDVGNAFAPIDMYSDRVSGNIGGLRWFNSTDTEVRSIVADVNGQLIFVGPSAANHGGISSAGAWSTNGGSLSAGATTTTTMRNSSNAGTGDDITYYDSDGDLTRSTIDIADVAASIFLVDEQTITTAQIGSGSPVALIDAGGANTVIMIHAVFVSMDYNSTTWTSAGSPVIEYADGSNIISIGTAIYSSAGDTHSSPPTTNAVFAGGSTTNSGIQFVISPAPTTGNSELKIKIWYTIESI